jgi:hypothetical protein
MAKDIKLYKDGAEISINETQLENFLELGYKQEQEKKTSSAQEKKETERQKEQTKKGPVHWPRRGRGGRGRGGRGRGGPTKLVRGFHCRCLWMQH